MFLSIVFKRFVTGFLLLAISFATFFAQVEKSMAYSTIDQHVDSADGYFRILTHQLLGQNFRPAMNKIDGLGAYTGIQPAGPNSCNLTLSLYKNTTPPTKLAEKTQTIYKMEAYTIIDIPAVDVVPEARYSIYATADSPYAYWLAKMSNIYPRGAAVIDSVSDVNVDMVFATFGYNGVPPAIPDPVPVVEVSPNSTGGDAGVAATSDTASTESSSDTSSAVSTSISAPTKLSATTAANGTASLVDLAWTASKTTDITGYKIFRSLLENDGFTEIGSTDPKTFTFKDNTAITNQAYFYFVRAYKAASTSVKSNVATATVADKTAPLVPANFKIKSLNQNEIVFVWDKNSDADMANYIFTVAENANADAKVLLTVETIGKDEVTYSLKLAENSGLAVDKNYSFFLQAKDVNNNISEKATTEGMFVVEKPKSNLWLLVGLGALDLVLLGLLIFLIIRRRKKAKAKI